MCNVISVCINCSCGREMLNVVYIGAVLLNRLGHSEVGRRLAGLVEAEVGRDHLLG